MIAVGTRVSYEDMANPLREGAIVGEVADQWLVLWDADHAVGLDASEAPVTADGETRLVRFHASVTKHMLGRAAERQEQARGGRRGRVGGWNVQAGLSQADLDAALDDERHLGWGYAGRDDLPYATRQALDAHVVAVANELGLDREGLFHWANSKNGRWLCDHADIDPPTRDLVRIYLNDVVVAELADAVI